MQLLMTRKTLSIRFASVCFAFIIIATSMMTIVLYDNGNNTIIEVNAANINSNAEVDEPTTEAIAAEVLEEIYDYSTIVSPDVYYGSQIVPSDNSYNFETVPYDIYYEDDIVEIIIPNRDKIDISLLKSPDYLPNYTYGEPMIPSVEIPKTVSNTDMRNYTDVVDTTNYLYLGEYSITGYTPKCAHCCGSTKGITASGAEAIIGYTVATHDSIPFGTTLYIEGYGYYIVEDRGNLGRNVIDIAAPTHDSCYDLTNNGVHVYAVPPINY